MALPTDGYAASSVTYSLGTSSGLTMKVTVGTDTQARREAFEQFQPFLETALNDLRASFQANTDPAQTVLYLDRSYDGSVRDSLPEA
jgi:hypothetical protein